MTTRLKRRRRQRRRKKGENKRGVDGKGGEVVKE